MDPRADNLAMWEEMAGYHPASPLYDVDGFVAGRDDLRPWEDEELGPVDGLDLLHLQCHIGTDTLCWARRGARVTGLDFSATALAAAGDLAARCGLEAEWVEADVYEARRALGRRTFDVVYTGIGALCWLPDVGAWAQVVRSLLKPGGRLYLMEIHPTWTAVWSDGKTIVQHAIDAEYVRWEDDGDPDYADPTQIVEHGVSHQRLHTIGEILTAILDAGMRIDLYREHAATPAPSRWSEQGPEGLYRMPDGACRIPMTYSLIASAPT
jgi:2-polyprenyl-3-methyl-5-hydroxy-6-metoxy-1,4-benzoquinol methylase